MHKQWIGCDATNFQTGRSGSRVCAIVLHRSGGSLAEIDARYARPRTFASAHYAVGVDGAVHQYVEEKDTAYHAGVLVNPTWAGLQPGCNPNYYTVAIEFEGAAGDAVPDAQAGAAAALIAEIAERSQFAPSAATVALHSEIRAGRACPGDGLDRAALLARVPAAQAQNGAGARTALEVRVLSSANVREGAPSTSARIVRVLPVGTSETTAGFTDQGERIRGNSYWYRTADGNYFWAGATATPNPVATPQPQPVPPVAALPAPSGPRLSGIPRIDALFGGTAAVSIAAGETDAQAVGAIQDLLTGLGFPGLPTILSPSWGTFGQKTADAVTAFQSRQSIQANGCCVDCATLQKMVAAPAPDPRASQVYMTLVLGFPFTGMHRVLSLVAQMEGVGKFAALNRNTDRAGLSFGLIQWAQKPGRLAEILAAFCACDRDEFTAIFGDGDAALADALLSCCRQPFGGVDPSTGQAGNPAFNLAADPWITRFQRAALHPAFQATQVQAALAAFNKSWDLLRAYAPGLTSERAVGFSIDVANQFGDGGLKKIYTAVNRPGMSETDLLEAIADETVARIADPFKAGVRTRRDRFLETPLLSNQPFTPEAQAQRAGD